MKQFEKKFYKEFMKQDGYYLIQYLSNKEFPFFIQHIEAQSRKPWLSISEEDFIDLTSEQDIYPCYPIKSDSLNFFRISKGG